MNRHGFTLIELLIVVVIIGILAAVAVPKFSATKTKSYMATMKSDLKNLASAQESYFYDNNAYYSGALPNPQMPFNPTRNVTITIQNVTVAGWAATSAYAGIGATCAIYYGTPGAIPPPATQEGSPACN